MSTTPLGESIQFAPAAGVAGTTLPLPRLFAIGKVGSQTRAIAIDAETGAIVWQQPLPSLLLDSWSMPTIDAANGTVLFATGSAVTALQLTDGSPAWTSTLPAPATNVTPVVTDDLGPRNRAFATGYGGFGDPSQVICINTSPRDEATNPFDPGDIVWTAPIGSASGATPAYLDGVVYVCSTGLDSAGNGEIRAFDVKGAAGATPPEPMFVFVNPVAQGFFGGVSVRESGDGLFVYAASYATSGGHASANLVKVNAVTGELAWSVPCNRTDSIPIVLSDGRIVLSTGISGYGSVPMVQCFLDQGSSVMLLWSTAVSTWNDANANGLIELGEFLLVGGWTTQPILTTQRFAGASPHLLVGALPTGAAQFGAYTMLYDLNLDVFPGQPGFVTQSSTQAGSTPAMLGGGVYSVGVGGLSALGPPPPRADLDGDGAVTIEDLAAWERGAGGATVRDVDRDGAISVSDRSVLLFELRRNEHRQLLRRRGGETP